MKTRSITFRRLFSGLSAATVFVSSSPLLFAAEEATEEEPVWVLSYAAFIFFSAAVIGLAIFLSKGRRETLLDLADQKRVDQIRTERLEKRRKEQRRAAMEAAKKAGKKR